MLSQTTQKTCSKKSWRIKNLLKILITVLNLPMSHLVLKAFPMSAPQQRAPNRRGSNYCPPGRQPQPPADLQPLPHYCPQQAQGHPRVLLPEPKINQIKRKINKINQTSSRGSSPTLLLLLLLLFCAIWGGSSSHSGPPPFTICSRSQTTPMKLNSVHARTKHP